jgi:hypothetical protein
MSQLISPNAQWPISWADIGAATLPYYATLPYRRDVQVEEELQDGDMPFVDLCS